MDPNNRGLSLSKYLVTARNSARTWRNRWVDLPMSRLEQTRRQLLRGDVDVLVLGESSALSVAEKDTDLTLLPELIAREMDARVVSLSGPGFGARVYSELLRVLGTLDVRPRAVVVACNIRANTSVHVTMSPLFSYQRSIGALAQVESAQKPIRAFGRGTAQDELDYAAFRAQPVHTRWGGDSTIGAFRDRLAGLGRPPWPREIERTRFDYFHGEDVLPGTPGLAQLTTFGRRLAAYGVPAATYWSPPPMSRGEMHFPGEFTPHILGNLDRMEAALRAAAPELAPAIRVPFEDDDFEDVRNATEHYAHSGRVKIARAVAEQLAGATI